MPVPTTDADPAIAEIWAVTEAPATVASPHRRVAVYDDDEEPPPARADVTLVAKTQLFAQLCERELKQQGPDIRPVLPSQLDTIEQAVNVLPSASAAHVETHEALGADIQVSVAQRAYAQLLVGDDDFR